MGKTVNVSVGVIYFDTFNGVLTDVAEALAPGSGMQFDTWGIRLMLSAATVGL